MREIKFIGKRVDNGNWVYGSFIHNSIDCPCIIDYDAEQYEIIPKSVGQFTGLKDKNGKEIYEGDVLRSIGTMEDGKYKFDCQYKVNKMDYKGFSLSFLKLTNELPDSIDNSYPIIQSPCFYYEGLSTKYVEGIGETIVFKDCWGENAMLGNRWKTHDFTDNIEIIGNIHEQK